MNNVGNLVDVMWRSIGHIPRKSFKDARDSKGQLLKGKFIMIVLRIFEALRLPVAANVATISHFAISPKRLH
jgi:hypothetical protein